MTETSAAHTAPLSGKTRTYTLVFLVLIGVTLAMLLTGEILFARNTPRTGLRDAIILGFSTTKALLIVMFYMHLKYEARPVQLIAAVPLLFLAILMIILNAFPNPVAPAFQPGAAPAAPEVPPVPAGLPHATPAASGGPAGAAVGVASAAHGEALFKGQGLSVACATCHSAGSDRIVGPGLKGVADRGGVTYIRESIVDPAAKIAPGFSNDMPPIFAKELCGKDTTNPADVAGCQNLDDLVAYLVSLK